MSKMHRFIRHMFYFGVASLPLCTGAALAKVDVEAQGKSKIMHFNVEDVRFKTTKVQGQTFQKASLVGVQGYEAILYKEGQPELPVIRFFTTGTIKVDAEARTTGASLESGMRLAPAQAPRIKKPNVNAPFVINQAAYASNTMLPKQLFDIKAAGSINGQAQYLVTLYPVAYAPGTGRWEFQSNFTVTVTEPKSPKENKLGASQADHERFVFVVGAKYAKSASLANYQSFKQQLGYQVTRIDVTTKDTPETIRAQLKTIYALTDAKLRYALIIGDVADVPSKSSTLITGVTDHYYRAIDTDAYDTDINGPDIGVGRVAVATEAQLAAVLAKFTRYQKGAFNDESWLNEISFLATDDRYEVAEGTHNYVIDTYTNPKGYTGIFPNAEQAGGDQLYAITHKVTGAKAAEILASNGRTIIDYSGHGSPTSWAGPDISQADIRKMKDPNALPFVIGNACNTGDFRTAESFGETWERHPNGAILYWGSMDSTYWDEDDLLERAMFDGIYRDNKARFSEVLHFASAELWRHYGGDGKSKYYWETYVIFGDPSLDLRTTKTHKVSVSGPTSLRVGASEVTYAVKDDNGPVANARVALVSASTDYELAGNTDVNGKIVFNISDASRKKVKLALTVSGANIPVTAGELKID